MLEFLRRGHLPLCMFFRSTCAEGSSISGRALFPCPPLYPFWQPPLRGSRRRCQRWEATRAEELWVNCLVLGLSHLAVARSPWCPPRGRAGAALSAEQLEMIHFLRGMVRSMRRLAADAAGSGQSLNSIADRVEKLKQEVGELSCVPYSRPRCGELRWGGSHTLTETGVADQFDFPATVRDFDPAPYLSARARRAYEDPDSFLKEEALQQSVPPVSGTTTRAELLRLLGRWDAVGRLGLYPEREINDADTAEVFGVLKREAADGMPKVIRQIIHRRRCNVREWPLAGYSRKLPHAVLMCLLPLEQDKVAAASVDDLCNYFHYFVATEAKARSNPIGRPWRGRQLEHLAAHGKRFRPDELVRACYKACPWGTAMRRTLPKRLMSTSFAAEG